MIGDKFAQVGPRIFRVERTWKNLTTKEQEAVLICELQRLGELSFYMIPAISYNGNFRYARAGFKGLSASSMGAQDAAESIAGAQWVIAGDRSTLPACTISESGNSVVAMYARSKDASFSACSLEPVPAGMTHRLWWPHQDQPYRITGSGRLPNGLIYARYDDKLAMKDDPEVDTRNMGDAAYFYLLASELADKAKRSKPF